MCFKWIETCDEITILSILFNDAMISSDFIIRIDIYHIMSSMRRQHIALNNRMPNKCFNRTLMRKITLFDIWMSNGNNKCSFWQFRFCFFLQALELSPDSASKGRLKYILNNLNVIILSTNWDLTFIIIISFIVLCIYLILFDEMGVDLHSKPDQHHANCTEWYHLIRWWISFCRREIVIFTIQICKQIMTAFGLYNEINICV